MHEDSARPYPQRSFRMEKDSAKPRLDTTIPLMRETSHQDSERRSPTGIHLPCSARRRNMVTSYVNFNPPTGNIMNRDVIFVAILLTSLLAGCASVPTASLEADKNAKQFVADPSKANIYLYRNESFGGAIAMPVSLDGKIAGKTGPATYFFWTVEPGVHEITSLTENTARIQVNTRAGNNHYIWQEVKMGMWTARSQLHEVSEGEGRKAVNECKLIESEM